MERVFDNGIIYGINRRLSFCYWLWYYYVIGGFFGDVMYDILEGVF